MRKRLRPALLLSLGAACTMAAAQGAYFPSLGGVTARLPITSMQAARTAGTVLQQYDFSCGSAALATLLSHHYGHPVSEQEVLQQMYAVGDQQKIQTDGFSMLDMKRYLKGIGFEADGFEQPLDKLVQAGLPAIVLVNEGSYHHFVVVKGMRGDTLLIGDPARGIRAVSRKQFESSWVGGMLFVIHNRANEARFNLAAEWRAAPRAPLSAGVPLEGVAGSGLLKNGPGDF
jgi:predicted double-glycine peptidase